MKIQKEIDFILAVDALKNVQRRNYNADDSRRENELTPHHDVLFEGLNAAASHFQFAIIIATIGCKNLLHIGRQIAHSAVDGIGKSIYLVGRTV